MANNEIYHISIGIDVKDKDVESKLKKIEKQADKIKKTKISTTATVKDNASSVMDKIEKKTQKFKNAKLSATATVKDSASSILDKVKNATDKLNNKEAKIKVKAQDEASKVIESANNKLNSWLKAGAKKIISIGLAGAVAAGGFGVKNAIQTYSDFEYGMKTVQATSQATDSELEKLTDTAKHLGATTAFSAKESADAMNYLAMAGFKTNDIIDAMPGLLDTAAASGESLSSVSDIISDGLTAFGLKAKDTGHFSDVMAQASANANLNIGMLGESFKQFGSIAGSMGYNIEDVSVALGTLANNGIKGGTAGMVLKNMVSNMAAPTKAMQGVMNKYGLSLTDSEGRMKSLGSVIDMLREKMGGVNKDQLTADASHLFGKEAMAGAMSIINASTEDYEKLRTAIYSADGAAKKMADTKLDTLSGQWTILKSAVEGMNNTLGEKLAPYAKQFITWFTGKIPDITNGIVGIVDTISKHTDDIKGIAIAIGGIFTAMAGLNVAGSIGNSLSGVTKLVSLFKGAGVAGEATKVASSFSIMGLAAKALPLLFSPAGAAITAGVAATAVGVHEYNKLMDESILTAKEDLDPIERFFDSINGNKHKTKQELQDLGLVCTDFGEDVSDSFKDAAKEASKSMLEMEMNINRLNRSGKIADNNMSSFKNYINEFAYAGINEIRNKQSEIKQELTKTFNFDGVVNDKEQGTLNFLDKFYEEAVNKELDIRDQIYEIGSKSIAENGKIIDSDMEQIKEKLAEIQALKLEYANAESAGETAYASSKFKSQSDRVTGLEGASELLQDRIKTYNDQMDEAKANYDKSIATTSYLLEHATDENEKSTLQSELDDLQKLRDESIQRAKESYKSDLETFYESNGEYKGRINEKTGAIFDDHELESQRVMQKQQDMHDMSNVTESGVYALKNNKTGNIDELYVSVDKETKDIMGIYNATMKATGAYSEQEKETLNSVKESYAGVGQEIDFLIESHAKLNTSTGELKNSFGRTIGSLKEVTAVGDGLVTGLMEIEDKPFKVTCDTEGFIKSIQEVTEATKNIPSNTDANISTNATETTGETDGVTQSIESIPPNTEATITADTSQAEIGINDILGKLRSIGSKMWNATVNFFTGGSSEVNKHASGTDYATAGLSTVNEQGWELSDRPVSVLGSLNGNPLVNLQQGTKIRNHMDSVNDMKQAVKQEVAEQQQAPVQVFQPQLAMAGVQGGNNFSFGGLNIIINDNNDVMQIVQEAQTQFGQQLLQMLQSIKK